MPKPRARSFSDGDLIRCFKDQVIVNWNWHPAWNCEFERSGYTGLGLVNDLGNFIEVPDFSDASVKIEKGDEKFKVEFVSMEDCKKSEHKCILTPGEVSYLSESVNCTSDCVIRAR